MKITHLKTQSMMKNSLFGRVETISARVLSTLKIWHLLYLQDNKSHLFISMDTKRTKWKVRTFRTFRNFGQSFRRAEFIIMYKTKYSHRTFFFTRRLEKFQAFQ